MGAPGLPWIQSQLLGTPIAIRAALTVAVLAPLGLVMGMFFPLGIRRAEEVHENLVPWAWAINGCASVTGGVVAVVLAMNHGFTQVWFLSVAIYAVGVAVLLYTSPPSGGGSDVGRPLTASASSGRAPDPESVAPNARDPRDRARPPSG